MFYPKETQSELFNLLLTDPLWVQARRLIVSMTVYIILLLLVVDLPLRITKFVLVHFVQQRVSEVRVWYFIPELQLPLEVAVGHFAILTILEGRKNYVGRFMYLWLLFLCKKLNITRFILPCPVRTRPNRVTIEISANEILKSNDSINNIAMSGSNEINYRNKKVRETVIKDAIFKAIDSHERMYAPKTISTDSNNIDSLRSKIMKNGYVTLDSGRHLSGVLLDEFGNPRVGLLFTLTCSDWFIYFVVILQISHYVVHHQVGMLVVMIIIKCTIIALLLVGHGEPRKSLMLRLMLLQDSFQPIG